MASKCKTCNGKTAGFKCDICGVEAKKHDQNHGCGGEHCMPKCAGCDEAEVNCSCWRKNTRQKIKKHTS